MNRLARTVGTPVAALAELTNHEHQTYLRPDNEGPLTFVKSHYSNLLGLFDPLLRSSGAVQMAAAFEGERFCFRSMGTWRWPSTRFSLSTLGSCEMARKILLRAIKCRCMSTGAINHLARSAYAFVAADGESSSSSWISA
jgi:hypothetical protein